ncbi:MAG TPA: tRNA lysidine(34) synthetase TilS [Niabella sp.]|nr:tRNA lysidine(34) synthetase TilS [Niabella sp.]
MDLLNLFIKNYKSQNLFDPKSKLLVAVSGGVDSVALCQLCRHSGLKFAVVHCNFQLRGDDSERDERFVASLAAQLEAPFFSVKFDTKKYAEENKVSTQVAARELRYHWFEQVRKENNYDYILTAHHADDNVETVLMSFFRGTGIRGLTGIKSKNGKIRRPLLFARRSELENFIEENKLPYVQDESNLHDDYTRNYFRNTVLPMIEKIFPEASENILSNIERMKEVSLLYRQAIEQHRKKMMVPKGNEWFLPVLLLQKSDAVATILFEIVREYGFTSGQVSEIINLLDSESGKYIVSPTHRILKDRRHLIISPLQESENTSVIMEGFGEYAFAGGTVIVKEMADVPSQISADDAIAMLDAKNISFPLILRPWKTGDYFYPLGMPKKKKVSRFLIDKKLSLIEKERVWVVEMNKKIIWVLGYRIDNRFKITLSTEKIIQLELRSN